MLKAEESLERMLEKVEERIEKENDFNWFNCTIHHQYLVHMEDFNSIPAMVDYCLDCIFHTFFYL